MQEHFGHAASKDFTQYAVQSIISKDCILDSGSTGQSTEAMIVVKEDRMTVINLPGHMPDSPTRFQGRDELRCLSTSQTYLLEMANVIFRTCSWIVLLLEV